jgi:hypothetical protein
MSGPVRDPKKLMIYLRITAQKATSSLLNTLDGVSNLFCKISGCLFDVANGAVGHAVKP